MITFDGVNSIINKLDSMASTDYKSALVKSALIVENSAKENCPVGTGQLRSSITHDINGNEATIGTNVEYAPYIEYGTGLWAENGDGRKNVPWSYRTADGEWHSTVGMMPQPYIRPALENNRDEIIKLFKKAIAEDIKNDRLQDSNTIGTF